MEFRKATKREITLTADILRDRSVRNDIGLYAIEGNKIVYDRIIKGDAPEHVVLEADRYKQDIFEKIVGLLPAEKILLVSARDINRISVLKNNQGMIAVFSKKNTEDEETSKNVLDCGIICDNIQDPINLGVIARTAVAFSYKVLRTYGFTVDKYNPKVIRSSSGAILDLNITDISDAEIEDMRKLGVNIYLTTPQAEQAVEINNVLPPKKPYFIVLGNEGSGVSCTLKGMADYFVCLPINNDIESLNVTAAAAILLYLFSKGV